MDIMKVIESIEILKDVSALLPKWNCFKICF